MKFSTKTRYGIRVMVEIASTDPEKGILQKDIAINQSISNKYLDQIIQGLKVAGLIVKIGGTKSGYILTKAASEITLLDIHNSFEPGICVIDCMSTSFRCPKEKGCKMKGFWAELNNKIIDHFKSKTLLDLINTTQTS